MEIAIAAVIILAGIFQVFLLGVLVGLKLAFHTDDEVRK